MGHEAATQKDRKQQRTRQTRHLFTPPPPILLLLRLSGFQAPLSTYSFQIPANCHLYPLWELPKPEYSWVQNSWAVNISRACVREDSCQVISRSKLCNHWVTSVGLMLLFCHSNSSSEAKVTTQSPLASRFCSALWQATSETPVQQLG